MCESNAYVIKDGKEELYLESVDLLENDDGEIKLTSLFGEKKTFAGRIKTLSLVDHKIILEPN